MILQDLSVARFGVPMTIWGTDPSYGYEIQRDSVTIGILPPKPLTGFLFIDQPPDASSHTYQVRHVRKGFNPGDWLVIGSGSAVRLDPETIAAAINSPNSWPQVSTGQNRQASVLPSPFASGVLSYASITDASNNSYLSWTWASHTIWLPDGSSIVVAASSTLPKPAAPTLSDNGAGTLGAATYFVRVAYVLDGNIYPVSAEASLALAASHNLKITSPPAQAGFTKWAYFISTATNTEMLASLSETIGVDKVVGSLPAGHVSWDATNWQGLTIANASTNLLRLAQNTTYICYPTYDVSRGIIRFPWGGRTGPSTTSDQPSARDAYADGNIGYFTTGVSATTAATSGSGSGGGGGRL